MQMKVSPRRRKGKALSQHEVQTAEPVYGDLVVVQSLSTDFNRYSNIARFQVSGANDVQPLPELHDAVLSWMGPNGFVLSGLEMIDGTAYAQSWWCRTPNDN